MIDHWMDGRMARRTGERPLDGRADGPTDGRMGRKAEVGEWIVYMERPLGGRAAGPTDE